MFQLALLQTNAKGTNNSFSVAEEVLRNETKNGPTSSLSVGRLPPFRHPKRQDRWPQVNAQIALPTFWFKERLRPLTK